MNSINDDYSISLHFSDPALELGSVAIPRLFLRFYPYLRGADGTMLDPREAFFLLYVMAEKDGGNNFRLATMVCPFTLRTRAAYAGKLRQMGLIYSIAHYVTDSKNATQSRPPATRVHHVDWVLDALFYNLSQVYQDWHKGYAALQHERGKTRVFYTLPDDYRHAIMIPPHLALGITEGLFYRVADHLVRQGRALTAQFSAAELATARSTLPFSGKTRVSPSVRDSGSHGAPRVRESGGHGSPSVRKSGSALLNTSTTIVPLTQILKTFADAIGVETYEPNDKEHRQIIALLDEGFTVETICAGIRRAVEYAKQGGQPARTIAYCIPEIRTPRESATVQPERVSQPTDETEKGTREPDTVSGQPRIETVPVSEPQSERTSLETLAGDDSEFLALLQLVQTKNAKALDAGDASAWRALAALAWVTQLAEKSSVSPLVLVTQAVQEAISAGSVKGNFLVPNLAKRILKTWQIKGRDPGNGNAPSVDRSVKPAARSSGLQYNSVEEWQAELEKHMKPQSTSSENA